MRVNVAESPPVHSDGLMPEVGICQEDGVEIGEDTPMEPRDGTGDPIDDGTAWLPGPGVEAKVASIFYDDLPTLDVSRLSDWLAHRLDIPSNERSDDLGLYTDALFDLSQLAEEFRFLASAGALYSLGLQDQIAAAIPDETVPGGGIAVPTVVRALLAGYMRPTPPPSALLHDPGQAIAGHRVLGGWWAAQLLDSALIRGMSALDRLAVLLFCADRQPIKANKHGDLALPAFRKSWLKQLKRWDECPEWSKLLEILDHPVFTLVKRYRDGFVHQRRTPMQLHGEHATTTLPSVSQKTTEGISAELHLAMVLGFYNLVLRPSCELVGTLIHTT